MQDSNIPTKFPIPWANGAGGSFVRSIPEASQIGTQNGAASLTDGFPPLNFLPVAGGGTPPFGADHNGILKQITQWLQWMQAGAPIPYDATFQTAIGGYPKGALVWSVGTPGALWQSTADNNTTNPDSGGAGWVPFTLVDAGAASGVGALILKGSSSFGANLKFTGNGVTTPSKFIRVVNGIMQWLNNAYTVAIATLDDAGNFTVPGTVLGNQLRATVGAFGSGDNNRATILSDFASGSAGSGVWQRFPNGRIIQFGSQSNSGGPTQFGVSFPTTFPSGVQGLVVTDQNPTTDIGGVAVSSWDAGGFQCNQSAIGGQSAGYSIFYIAIGI